MSRCVCVGTKNCNLHNTGGGISVCDSHYPRPSAGLLPLSFIWIARNALE